MLSAPPVAATTGGLAFAAPAGRQLLLICNDCDAADSPEKLRAFLEPFRARKVKLGLVFDSLSRRDRMTRLVPACTEMDPDLVEWLVEQPSILEEPAYYQMRYAAEAQADFSTFLGSCGEAGKRLGGALSLICPEPPTTLPSLDGVRTAGFRTVVLRPDQATDVQYWVTDNGVLLLRGGLQAKLSDLDRLMDTLFAKDESGGTLPLLIHLSLVGLPSFTTDELGAMADAFSAVMAAGIRDGSIVPILPSEFHLANAPVSRCIALHFAGGSDSSLLHELAAGGIPFSSSASGANVAAGCAVLSGKTDDPAWQGFEATIARQMKEGAARFGAPQACIVTSVERSDLIRTVAASGAAMVTQIAEDPSETMGLADDGLLHVPACLSIDEQDAVSAAVALEASLGNGRGRLRDAVVVIRADAKERGFQPSPLRDALLGFARGEGDRIVPLQDLPQRLMARDSVFELLKRTKAMDLVSPADPAEIDAAERAQLLEDAELAWRYFTRFTDPKRGLAFTAAQVTGGDIETYPYLAMWDVGSQILATISAFTIGIIQQREFEDLTDRALASIPATNLNGWVLPQANILANRGRHKDMDFNASDTGRLLVALKVLQQRFGMRDEVDRIVRRWDLQKTIVNRRLHHIEHGQLIEYFLSNYVGYAALGFALWGLETESPYAVPAGEVGTDWEMRVLTHAADRDAIRTEPHVLEELEIGYSDAARLIARVLFMAQASAHEATGKLFCVSEVPLDTEPWFAYEGFKLGAESDPWTVDTVEDLREYRSERFRTTYSMVSTKGAFAWAAVHPHPYSQTLLTYVRERGRFPDLGFASGIYVQTGKPTPNYSDSNTNAVILEAIAYILSGRQPALRLH